jgi:putative transposase
MAAEQEIEMGLETITRTVVIPLRTSKRKSEKIERYIDEWQEMARFVAERMPSWGEDVFCYQSKTRNKAYPILVDEFGEQREIVAAGMQAVGTKVAAAFSSWYSNGMRGDYPIGDYGAEESSFGALRHDQIAIERNRDGDFGVELSMFPYEGEWFRMGGGAYQHSILDDIVDGEVDAGSAEIHLDSDSADLHLSYSWEQPTIPESEAIGWIGLDINKRDLYVAAYSDAESPPKRVGNYTTGRSQQYHDALDALQRKIDRAQSKGDVQEADETRYNYRRNQLDNAAVEIVRAASERISCGIAVEDIANPSKASGSGFKHVPFGLFTQLISEHAEKRGVPFKTVDKDHTSQRCHSCGTIDTESRSESGRGKRFVCVECGTERDADFNAAVNIAERAAGVW